MIAQWAVNCTDMCDSDVIMTPFEYDEMPWDGWGCRDADANLVPIDGDAATDENKGQMIDWKQVQSNNGAKRTSALAAADVPKPLHQTRGMVWGAERPELLISETLAFHDRKASDESINPSPELVLPPASTTTQQPDPDLDQRLKPMGSLFVELVNPWSGEGARPPELCRYPNGLPHMDMSGRAPVPYRDPRTNAVGEGVLLHRQSDAQVTVGGAAGGPALARVADGDRPAADSRAAEEIRKVPDRSRGRLARLCGACQPGQQHPGFPHAQSGPAHVRQRPRRRPLGVFFHGAAQSKLQPLRSRE